jgi:hypothetical protein
MRPARPGVPFPEDTDMSDPIDTTLIEAAVVSALTPALTTLAHAVNAAEQRLAARIDALGTRVDAAEARMSGVMLGAQQLFRELSERMARLEARVESLTTAVGGVAGKLIAVELDLAEIKGRLDRLSGEVTRGFTGDADRYAALVKRVETLEALLLQPPQPHG